MVMAFETIKSYFHSYMNSNCYSFAQSCLTLCDPMDCSPPGSSIRGIFQVRVLEWGAIAFSDIYVYVYG